MKRIGQLALVCVCVGLLVAGCGNNDKPPVEVKKPSSMPSGNSTSYGIVGESIKSMPDTGLVDQNGDSVSFESLPSKPVVLSFIYTRCPMASMCPKVTKNMATLQDRVNKQGKRPAHFLLITFDPEYDRPDVLRQYAERYDVSYDNFSLWTGPQATIEQLTNRFGLMVKQEDGQPVAHNMKTFLISKKGMVLLRFRGSDWRVQEVLSPLMQEISAS